MDPEISDILTCRMTLHLMGSNAGDYVWIPMGCVKSLWGMPFQFLPVIFTYYPCFSVKQDISQLRAACLVCDESSDSVAGEQRICSFS